jgi:hypothetical protein
MNLQHAKSIAALVWIVATVSLGFWFGAGSPSTWLLVCLAAIGPATTLVYFSKPLFALAPAGAKVSSARGDHGWMSPQWLAEQRSSHQQ